MHRIHLCICTQDID